MPLRIELENLWKRLSTRYKARRKTDTDPEDPEHPILLETLQPVTDFDELAKDYNLELKGTIARTSGAGTGITSTLVVPDGERWHVSAIDIITTAGDGTLTTMYAVAKGGTPTLPIDVQAASVNFNTHLLPHVIVLDEGMGIAALVSAISTDSSWTVRVLGSKEDAF